MRDVHFDGEFLRDFAAASTTWTWATWHQIAQEREAAAQRLLRQVFGGDATVESTAEEGGDTPQDR